MHVQKLLLFTEWRVVLFVQNLESGKRHESALCVYVGTNATRSAVAKE